MTLKNYSVGLLVSICVLQPLRAQVQHKDVLQTMLTVSKNRPKVFMLSYPRSGNTWCRYWLECLTQRPTGYYFDQNNISNFPLALIVGHPIDLTKAPIWKIHASNELNFGGLRYNPTEDLLLFIVRNPKECILREAMALAERSPSDDHLTNGFAIYFDDLRLYDEWPADKKKLIYYEDLMTKPAEVITEVLLFLHEPIDKVDEFMRNYAYHKDAALKVYEHNGGSRSYGNDTLFYSRQLSQDDHNRIDEHMKNNYLYLWHKYLKDRYDKISGA